MSIQHRLLKCGHLAAFISFDGMLAGDVMVASGDITRAIVWVNRSFTLDHAEVKRIIVVERPETDGIDEAFPNTPVSRV